MIEADKQETSEAQDPALIDPTPRETWQTYKRLLGYVKPDWFIFLIAVIGFQMGNAAEAYFVKMFGDLIDSWPTTAMLIPMMMFVAALGRGIGDIIGELLLSRISFNVVHTLRTQLFDQFLQLPSAFFDASSQGHLVSRITFNVAQLRDTGTEALKSIVQDGGKLIVYFGAMLYLSWKLTLIFAATAPIVAVVVAYASRRFRRISTRIQNSMGDVTHVASETVTGYRVVRIFGGEAYEKDRFHRSSHYNRRQNLKMVATKVTSTQVIQIFIAVALSLLIALLFQPNIGGHLSTGEVVTFLGLAGLLANPIKKLTEVNARLQRGLAAARDVFGQLDQTPESDRGSYEADRVQGRIEFRNVSFAYQNSKGPVLRDLNVMIEPGQTVALVGRSGSGKSTLASLIPRFYEPQHGQILLDGRPVQDYTLSSLRRQIALVTQQVTLFNDTLLNNIAYGGLAGASESEISEAVRRAHADNFVEDLPEGLQTVVGDNGVLLSGGQRQRVAIARALLKDAPVLILDEATSALDNTSERYIQAALDEVMRGRTTLVIAHRLSTIEKADVILVMQDGRIVEVGPHARLLEQKGLYAELYNAQFEDEAVTAAKDRSSPAAEPPERRRITRLPEFEPRFSPLVRAWYSQSRWPHLLRPAAWLFQRLASRRRMRYLTGKRERWRAPVPVIVVGNITAGGTGKTPFTIWLVNQLRDMGFTPGIVSRGYGGSAKGPLLVTSTTAAAEAGDEAPLLAARTGAPVYVCADRVAAAKSLLTESGCDIVVADDGLQHYALARDVEIAIVDGYRGVGNGLSLPAGPLREPVRRLQSVDWVVSNGRRSGLHDSELLMQVLALRFVQVAPQGGAVACEEFLQRHTVVNALAGVGNPARFAQTLLELGLDPLLTAYADHHRFDGSELEFDNDYPIICTEKDATKLRELSHLPENLFYLEIDVSIEDGSGGAGEAALRALLNGHGILQK
ncbi:MAG: lipid A export permease/ATP-binding protein MsbA [Pseudomonadales bacterium]